MGDGSWVKNDGEPRTLKLMLGGEVMLFKFVKRSQENSFMDSSMIQFVAKIGIVASILPEKYDEIGCRLVWVTVRDRSGVEMSILWRSASIRRKRQIRI